MSLLAFFQWCSDSAISVAIRNSVWQFAVIQASHLCAVAVFTGAVLVVDLRLMGRGLKQQTLAQVAQDAQPWMMGSLFAIVLTGIPQFTTNAIKYYHTPVFWWKMYLLAVALVFTFTLRTKVTRADETRVGSFWAKVVAVVSIVLWTGVALGGRVIGFY